MQPVSSHSAPQPSRTVSLLAVVVGLWIAVGSAGLVVLVWFVGELASESERSVPASFPVATSLIGGALLATPAAALLAVARQRPANPRTLAASRAWLLAALAGAALGCVRATPLPFNELLLALVALVAALLGFAVRRWPARLAASRPGGSWRSPYGLILGLVLLVPWLAIGALGGVVETVAAGLAAVAVGYLVAGILRPEFFATFASTRPAPVFVGGLATGVALAPLAAALGGSGLPVGLLLTLPAAGFALSALAALGERPGLPVALIVVGPLAFVDPEETSLVLGLDDVGGWALRASLLGLAGAWAMGLVYGLLERARGAERQRGPAACPRFSGDRRGPAAQLRWRRLVALGLVVAAAVTAYVVPGRPGFSGERLFVVMAEQADLSGLAQIADGPTRRQATYARLVSTAERTQAPLRSLLQRLHIGYTPFYLVNGVLVDAGPTLRPFLSGRSDVDRILIDQRLRPLPARAPGMVGSTAPPAGPVPSVAAIGAPAVWATGDTGAGVTVGSSDTGVLLDHPALRSGYRGGEDSWYDPWNQTRSPTDHNGHGTHTTGTAVGRGGIGVAPGASWMACVNLDRDYGSPSRYLDCLQFMLAPFPFGGDPLHAGNPARAADILINSWGCPPVEGCDADALRPATDALAAAGIYVVVAAGNTGPDCGTLTDPPAQSPNVLTVGAVNDRNMMARFSSRGSAGSSKPDLVAPGVDVTSALLDDTYGKLNGTSMATPAVVGVVALMWSANPRLRGNIAATTRILLETTAPVAGRFSCDPRADAGAGRVDAPAAVAAARALT